MLDFVRINGRAYEVVTVAKLERDGRRIGYRVQPSAHRILINGGLCPSAQLSALAAARARAESLKPVIGPVF